MPEGWDQFDHIETVLRGYGAPFEIKAFKKSEYDTLNMTEVGFSQGFRLP